MLVPKPNARESICGTISHVLSLLGQHPNDMSYRFWHGIHRWLPFLSPGEFHESMVKFENPQIADFGVLLLSICLLGRETPISVDALDQNSLYITTKMLLTQLHSYNLISFDLVKAAVLIAVYEYATHNGDAAFVTLSMAIRTAYAIGLNQEPSIDQLTGPEQHELNNVWWMLVICERYLHSSTTRRYHCPTACLLKSHAGSSFSRHEILASL